MLLTEQEVDALRKSLPAVCKHQDVIRAAESAVLEKLKAQERDRNLLNYSCQMCLDTGVLPKAAILPEPPDVKCPNGCRPKKQLPPDDVVRDAERLDWLMNSGRIVICDREGCYTYTHTSGRYGPVAKTKREAIDAAMKEMK